MIDARVIRVARGEANRVSVRRRRASAVQPDAPRSSNLAKHRADLAMDSFELNKILGAVLGTCLACCR